MCRMSVLITVLATLIIAQTQEIRVDRFDTKGKRQGYTIINKDTGRIDHYDNDSKRIGTGQIQEPRSQSPPLSSPPSSTPKK